MSETLASALLRLSETDITGIDISPITSYNRDGTVQPGDKLRVFVHARTPKESSVAAMAFGPDIDTALTRLMPELAAKQSGEWFAQKRSSTPVASPEQNRLQSLNTADLLKELGI